MKGMSSEKISLKEQIHEIIFEADTPAGKTFDVLLLLLIISSVMAVILESVSGIQNAYGGFLKTFEWIVTILFTAEYLLRLWCVGNAMRYATSFFGIIDLLSTIPTYLSLFIVGGHYLLVLRALRLLRVFRVLKMVRYISEAQVLGRALKASMPKITVFIFTVITLVIIVGTAIYMIEGPEHGYTSIPVSMYWAIVTLTTVGYGDLAPLTTVGKMLASVLMIMGYGIIAVPTGIVSVELAQASNINPSTMHCRNCSKEGHAVDAAYCKHCGSHL